MGNIFNFSRIDNYFEAHDNSFIAVSLCRHLPTHTNGQFHHMKLQLTNC